VAVTVKNRVTEHSFAIISQNPVTEHSFPNYFSTIANVFDRYEYSDHSNRVTLISRANVEGNRRIDMARSE